MAAIENGTLLVKDSNGNTARAATLSQTDITTLNTALTDIGTNSVFIQPLTDQVKTIQGRYVDVDTQQNITGLKVFNRRGNGIICKEERMDVNVVPTSEIQNFIKWQDKNNHDVGMVKSTHETGNWHRMEMTAIAQDSSGNNIYGQLAVSIKPDGSIRTSCPQPPVNSNDSSIATTEWVNVKVKGLTGTDLSNHVDLSSTQTITGTKTFNDLKTVTPSASDNSTKVATTEWVKTKVDAISAPDLSNYVDLSSTQTIDGAKTFSAVVKAKTPATDSDDTSVATTAWVKAKVGTGSVDTSKVVDLTSAQTISGAKTFSSVTKSATPATGSDDTSVATTAWVNTKVRGLTGAAPDLSNYVDLSSTQTITGTKTFNDLKTVTPSASDNSTKVATTAWVKTKVDAVSEANKTETVASFSADMTINDDSATYSILTSASTITVASGTDTKGWSKCVKIENAGATISLGSGWAWKDGSQPTLTAPCLLCLVWIGNLGVAGIISTTAA